MTFSMRVLALDITYVTCYGLVFMCYMFCIVLFYFSFFPQLGRRNGLSPKIVGLLILFRQIWNISPIGRGLSVSVSHCLCYFLAHRSYLSENQKWKKNEFC